MQKYICICSFTVINRVQIKFEYKLEPDFNTEDTITSVLGRLDLIELLAANVSCSNSFSVNICQRRKLDNTFFLVRELWPSLPDGADQDVFPEEAGRFQPLQKTSLRLPAHSSMVWCAGNVASERGTHTNRLDRRAGSVVGMELESVVAVAEWTTWTSCWPSLMRSATLCMPSSQSGGACLAAGCSHWTALWTDWENPSYPRTLDIGEGWHYGTTALQVVLWTRCRTVNFY